MPSTPIGLEAVARRGDASRAEYPRREQRRNTGGISSSAATRLSGSARIPSSQQASPPVCRAGIQLLLALLGLLGWPSLSSAQEQDAWPSCESTPLPMAAGGDPGLDHLRSDLDALLQDAVDSKVTQAAALIAVHRGEVIYRSFAGGAGPQSIFDLASLTKVVATVPSIMSLVDEGKLHLSDRVSRYLKLLEIEDKKSITVEQLLTHTAGLHSVVWAGKPEEVKAAILERIARSVLKAVPGQAYRYSDIGYILLGELAAEVAQHPLERVAWQRLFKPLGLCSTGFNPPSRLYKHLITPWPRGEKIAIVYDPLAARMKGVAGHAGLFSTADDLARFGQMMLGQGALNGVRVLSPQAVATMTRPRPLPGAAGQRGLGWDFSSPHAGSKGLLSDRAYGHTGFTGTSIWIDPLRDLVIVLLTNRTYREPAPSVSPLRRRVHDLLAIALVRPAEPPVQTGLDRLVEQDFASLRGKRVALITNRTAVDRRGRWIIDLLSQVPEIDLRAIFVPEHGLAAEVDRSVGDATLKQAHRRIPVYSLFGTRRRPTAQTLSGVQVLVFDVQTVGVRYYTYLATMGWAMEEAAHHGLPFIVLDRPDPLGGAQVQGPVSSEARRTSTNYHPLPVRYGLTTGELARLFNGERRLKVSLTVVPLAHWSRQQLFPQLGLPWVNPSPNIRAWQQALLYAGVGLLESTNVSVGRGTASPFALLGAPWIDGRRLATLLNQEHLNGLHFVAVKFTSTASPYKGQLCQGVRLIIFDPQQANPVAAGLALAVALRQLYPKQWETQHLFRLINHPPTISAILAGKKLREVLPLWTAELKRFNVARQRYLLY
jgi:uncharacterized protein YbbC (DUF1343 family)